MVTGVEDDAEQQALITTSIVMMGMIMLAMAYPSIVIGQVMQGIWAAIVCLLSGISILLWSVLARLVVGLWTSILGAQYMSWKISRYALHFFLTNHFVHRELISKATKLLISTLSMPPALNLIIPFLFDLALLNPSSLVDVSLLAFKLYRLLVNAPRIMQLARIGHGDKLDVACPNEPVDSVVYTD